MNKRLVLGISIMVFASLCSAEQQITKSRQQLFKSIEDNSEKLEDIVDVQNWSQAAELANQLSLDVLKLKKMFPESSKGEGRSKSKIWKNKQDFNHRLKQWAMYFNDVATNAKHSNKRATESALDEATSTCRSCHMKYRSLW